MASMQALFAEFFTYVLLFEHMTTRGEFEPSYGQVRQDIAALLERQQTAAKRAGMPEVDYQEARFAIVAWADEAILKHSTWAHHSAWSAMPLQLEYYQTRNAGEELFERLERLPPEQHAVREIYYICLGLGFSGQYFRGLEDEHKLAHIRHEQAKRLTRPVEAPHEIATLTPQPYTVAPSQGQPITLPLTSQLLKVALALLLVVPLGLFVAYKLLPPPAPTLAGHGASSDVPPPPPPGSSCAPLAVGNVPRLLCPVIELLEPLKHRGEAQALGLLARLNKLGSLPSYVAGEDLAVEVQTPPRFDSFVYVDYYSADGTVVHLFPSAQEAMPRLGRSQALMVNQINGQALEIQAPFGIELVTVVASTTPLFLSPRAGSEEVAGYVDALRRALTQEGEGIIRTATFSWLTTRDNK
jgi:type IV/VI secretion system ImpK/VasF family protein